MAYAYATLMDVAKVNAPNSATPLIESVTTYAPEVGMFPARVIDGTDYDTLLRTALPEGAFRNANEGVEPTKSSYETRKVQTFIYESAMEHDVKVLEALKGGPSRYLALEEKGHVRKAVIKLGSQIWYGTSADAKGFLGAQSIVSSAITLDATGSTANTGSSVYGVKLGEDFVSLVFGMNQTLSARPWVQQFITRNSKELLAWKSNLSAWVGCQWVDVNCVGRIKNLTAQSGKTLTDDLGAQLIEKFPGGYVPDFFFMTRRSRRQLQQSRTPVSTALTAGNLNYPPIPTEMCGIPIIVTDSLLNTEAIS